MNVKLLIVCEVRLYREGLVRSLRRRGWRNLSTTDSSGSAVVDKVRECEADVVLLDVDGPDGLKVLELLLREVPDVKVVALGVEEEPDAVLGLMEAGAAGYVPRDATIDDLHAALEAVRSGGVRCSPSIAGSLVRRVATLANDPPTVDSASHLTNRERQVLALIEQGCSNKQIARALGVKVPTVKNHVHNLLAKLGVDRRGAAAALARESLRGSAPDAPVGRGAHRPEHPA